LFNLLGVKMGSWSSSICLVCGGFVG
jgi:hypothetical protein